MAPENRPPTKRRRLPFDPPRPRASPSAGPSSTPNDANKKATKKRSSANARTSSAASKPRTSTSSTQRNPSPTPPSSPSSESSPRNRNRNRDDAREDDGEPDYILAEVTTHEKDTTDVLSSAPTVPPKLLTRLLAHHFQDPKTKLAKDANGVVAKYVDVFVREALARAAYESSGGAGGDARGEGTGRGGGIGDGFLEVEDLEKMAPQLILDF